VPTLHRLVSDANDEPTEGTLKFTAIDTPTISEYKPNSPYISEKIMDEELKTTTLTYDTILRTREEMKRTE